jgi:hypothetical protein
LFAESRRITRAFVRAPVVASLACWLAAEVAELCAARTFDVMASLGELDGASAVWAQLELSPAFIRLDHLLLVRLHGLALVLAVMINDITEFFELCSAHEAAVTLAGGVQACLDSDVLFAFTWREEAADELATGAENALGREGGVLDSLELVSLEEVRVHYIGVVERSLIIQLNWELVLIVEDSSDHLCQTLETDVVAEAHDTWFILWFVLSADNAKYVSSASKHGFRCGLLFSR